MDQYTLDLDPLPKKTRKEVFLQEMNLVVAWATLVALITPFARGAHQALGGRPPFPIETMPRIHCLQLWWNLSDRPWKKSCTSARCTVALQAWMAQRACPTKPTSCAFAICWRSTNWPRRCWPPSTPDGPSRA